MLDPTFPPQQRSFAYTVPSWTGDPRTAAAFRAVLDRDPVDGEVVQPVAWVGRRCVVVLDWCRDERGRQVVWVREVGPPAPGA